jgi:hypothetical protein
MSRPHPWSALLLILPAWWTVRLGFGFASWCFLDGVNLAFHEAGHLFFSFGGSTLHYLGGTLGQVLVPAALGAHFLLRREQPFAAALCLWWLGESLVNVSIYMADARALALPLVGGGDHDWNELFHRFGLLGEDAVLRTSGLTRAAGVLTMLAGLAWAAVCLHPAVTAAWRDAEGRAGTAGGRLPGSRPGSRTGSRPARPRSGARPGRPGTRRTRSHAGAPLLPDPPAAGDRARHS